MFIYANLLIEVEAFIKFDLLLCCLIKKFIKSWKFLLYIKEFIVSLKGLNLIYRIT
jgi:hypothetical protein